MVFNIAVEQRLGLGRERRSEAMHEERLDRAFAALADPVRRTIVARLSRSSATVNELAALFPITTQAVSRHIGVLEHSGLVTRTRDAQRRPVHLNPAALESLTSWLDRYRLDHERRFRALDAVLVRANRSREKRRASTKGTS
jgi:DNA-binding transcriptional ArsR family regulator